MMSVGLLAPNISPSKPKCWNFNVYIYLHVRLSATGVLISREEFWIYSYVVTDTSPLVCSTHGGMQKESEYPDTISCSEIRSSKNYD